MDIYSQTLQTKLDDVKIPNAGEADTTPLISTPEPVQQETTPIVQNPHKASPEEIYFNRAMGIDANDINISDTEKRWAAVKLQKLLFPNIGTVDGRLFSKDRHTPLTPTDHLRLMQDVFKRGSFDSLFTEEFIEFNNLKTFKEKAEYAIGHLPDGMPDNALVRGYANMGWNEFTKEEYELLKSTGAYIDNHGRDFLHNYFQSDDAEKAREIQKRIDKAMAERWLDSKTADMWKAAPEYQNYTKAKKIREQYENDIYRAKAIKEYEQRLADQHSWMTLTNVRENVSGNTRDVLDMFVSAQDNAYARSKALDKFRALPLTEQRKIAGTIQMLHYGKDTTLLGDAFRAMGRTAASVIEGVVAQTANQVLTDEAQQEIAEQRAILVQVNQERMKEWGWFADGVIGAFATIPYMAAAAIPYAGIPIMAATAADEMEQQVAAAGGDVTDPEFRAAKFFGGISVALVERIQVGQLSKLGNLSKRQLYCDMFHSINNFVKVQGLNLLTASNETLEEAIQGGITDFAVAHGLDQNDSDVAFLRGFVRDGVESLSTMLILSQVGGAAKAYQYRNGPLVDAEDAAIFALRTRELNQKLEGNPNDTTSVAEYGRQYGEIAGNWINAGENTTARVRALQRMGASLEQAVEIDVALSSIWKSLSADTASREELVGGRHIKTESELISELGKGGVLNVETREDGSTGVTVDILGSKLNIDFATQENTEIDPETQDENLIASIVKATGVTSVQAWKELAPEQRKEILDQYKIRMRGSWKITTPDGNEVDGAITDSIVNGTIFSTKDSLPQTAWHEYIHGVSDVIGKLAFAEDGSVRNQELAALVTAIGKKYAPLVENERFNEEMFADAFRDYLTQNIKAVEDKQSIFGQFVNFLKKLVGMKDSTRDLTFKGKTAADTLFNVALTGKLPDDFSAESVVEQERREAIDHYDAVMSEGEEIRFSIVAQKEQAEYDAVVAKYKDTDQWMKAPNGKPTNLTERQWVQVRTPSFKRWFGDWENDPANASKVVDENGEPMEVWHGSPNDFNVFDNEKALRGFYFAPPKRRDSVAGYYGEGKERAFFLNIKNPIEVTPNEKPKDNKLPENKDGWVVRADKEWNLKFYNYRTKELEEETIEKGDVIEIVTFSPNQIKSATDNVGTFDSSNPDIRYSVRVKVPKDITEEWVNYFNDYSTENKTDNDIFLDIKRLALLNSQAYKGYLVTDKDLRNDIIYETKDVVLTKIIKHILDGNTGIEVLYSPREDVVYFEWNGIQYSFHGLGIPRDQFGERFNQDLIDKILDSQKRTPIWSKKKIHQKIDNMYEVLDENATKARKHLYSQARDLWDKNNPDMYVKEIRKLGILTGSIIDTSTLETVLEDLWLRPRKKENDIKYGKYEYAYNNAKTKKTKDKYRELMIQRESEINAINEDIKERVQKVTELYKQMKAAPQRIEELFELKEFEQPYKAWKEAERELEAFTQDALNLMIEDFNSNSLLTSKGESILSNTIYDISDVYNANMEDGKNHDIPVALTEDYVCFALPQKHASEEIQNEYKNSTNKDIVDYVRLITKNKHNLQNIPNAIKISSNVSQRLIDAVQHVLNIDVSDFDIYISSDSIIHILNRHGINGKSDTSMSDFTDIGRIGFVINNLDSLGLIRHKLTNEVVLSNKWKNKENSKVPELLARKQVNGHFMVANVVVDSAKKQIQIISAYKNKEILTHEDNTLKGALALRPTTSVRNRISYVGIKPNFGTDVNTPSEKSRFSVTAAEDQVYLDAVKRGDMGAAQKMVDEAARLAGYTVKAYHGTLTTDFTEFKKSFIGSRFSFDDKGFFFIDRKNIAEDYARSEFDSNKKGRVLDVYLRVKNPLIVNAQYALKEGLGEIFKDNDVIDVWDNYSAFLLEEAETKRVDGIIIDDGATKMTVVFDSEQIKSADPVTYDDNGNVIPLSQRFNADNPDIRYSMAGVRAHTANNSLLAKAQKMLFADGVDAEKVRQETGWFRGLDGEWRYEIDDSQAKFVFPNHIKEIQDAYQVKVDKIKKDFAEGKFGKNAFMNQMSRAKTNLDWANDTTHYFADQTYPLNKILEHPKLFDAYPQLQNMPVVFRSGLRNELGLVNDGIMYLNTKYLKEEYSNSTEIIDVLLHEIQHEIQRIEGFARGASPRFWDHYITMLREEYESSLAELTKLYEDIGLPEFKGNSLKDVALEKKTLDQHNKDVEEFKNQSGLAKEIHDAKERNSYLWRQFSKALKSKNYAFELYTNTAGEIESRDVSARRALTEAERLTTRPDIDRKEDVQFAEMPDLFSLTTPAEKARHSEVSLKEQIDTIVMSDAMGDIIPRTSVVATNYSPYSQRSNIVAIMVQDKINGINRPNEHYESLALAFGVDEPVEELIRSRNKVLDKMRDDTGHYAKWTSLQMAASAEESNFRTIVENLFSGLVGNGSKMSAKAERAWKKAQARMIRAAKGRDLQDLINDTGLDIVDLLADLPVEVVNADPMADSDTGVGGDGDVSQTQPDAPLTEEELRELEALRQQRLAEARERVVAKRDHILKLLKEWRERERQRKEELLKRQLEREENIDPMAEPPLIIEDNAEDADDQGGESTGNGKYESECVEEMPDFKVFLDSLKDADVDINNVTELAALLHIWVDDWVNQGAPIPGRLQYDIKLAKYRKTMVQVLRNMADRMIDADAENGGYATKSVERMIESLNASTNPDQIQSRVEQILGAIKRHAFRIDRKKLIRDARKLIKLLAIKGKEFDELEKDIGRKISGEHEKAARYIYQILTWSDGKISRESEKLMAIIDGRLDAYKEASTDEAIKRLAVKDIEVHRATERLQALQRWGGLRKKTPAEIKAAVAEIQMWLEKERAEHERRWGEWQAAKDALAARLQNAIWAKDSKYTLKEPKAIGRFADELIATLRQRLEFITQGSGAEGEAVINEILYIINSGSERLAVIKEQYRKEYEDMLKACVDGTPKSVRDLLRDLDEEIPEELNNRLITDEQRTRMTYGQLLQLYASLSQITYKDNIESSEHYRVGQKQLIESFLADRPEMIRLVERMRGLYDARRETLSNQFQFITGMPMLSPDPLYMPVKMFRGPSDNLETTFRAWNPFGPSFTPRIKNRLDFDLSADITEMFLQRSNEAARAIAFGVRGMELRSILARKDTQNAIQQKYGKFVLRKIIEQVTDTLSDGFKTPSSGFNKIVQGLGSATTYSALSWNLVTMLKQMTSIPAWSAVMNGGYADVFKSISEFDREAAKELMNTDGFVARYGATDFGEMFKQAISDPTQNWLVRFYKAGMTAVQLGDFVPGILVGTGVYKAQKQALMRKGMSEQEAKQKAATTVWSMIEECQQSSRLENTPDWMRRQGFLARQLAKFASSPLLQTSHEFHSARMWRAAHNAGNAEEIRKWRKRFINQVLCNHLLMPVAMYTVATLFNYAILGDEPPELEELVGDVILQMIVGPMSRIFIIGALFEGVLARLIRTTGLKPNVYDNSGIAATQYLNKMLNRFDKMGADILDADWESFRDDTLDMIGQVVVPARYVVKGGRNIADYDAKAERAKRKREIKKQKQQNNSK